MNANELPLTPSADALADRDVSIKVIGLGGAGGNAVDRLKMDNLDRLRLAAINTDLQALNASPVEEKVLIGSAVTRGLGAGGDPDLGYEAAESDREKIAEVVRDTDLVFLIAGMGGGTGSGAAPTVAEIAIEAGALVIAFVTTPFSFEGGRRTKQAEDGLLALRRSCDAVIPLPNDILLQEAAEGETALDSFARADEWIGRAVRSVWAMMYRTGLINLDFATLRQAFHTRGGKTLFGLGSGSGETSTADAIASLEMCPLLATPEFSRKADRLLVNIVGGTDLTLAKVNEIMSAVTERYGRESHVIMGAVIDEDLQGSVEICVIGTSDIGGRLPPRRPVPVRAKQAAGAPPTPPEPMRSAGAEPEEVLAGKPSAPTRAAVKPKPSNDPTAQNEFFFQTLAENRGHFERTDRNLFEGQDLDVPTYFRKGLKISL
ncbi:cell division protein FtsZ [Synoicihabitans lomoniglobus]|uniref:Cell division protein FtsZ n=1 Tax=Synoicihabitans lomoniglobus TaxID=2909285 RepID=A0AAF0I1Z8_9BACT|nr:cell division protein FtsZ [Opitutaceae bacterium LMO-M01]WED66162.1 cell division protein FtsZ [Opitutaceae bacterium LMO-M01]